MEHKVIYKEVLKEVPTHNVCGCVLTEVDRHSDAGSLFSWYCPFCNKYF